VQISRELRCTLVSWVWNRHVWIVLSWCKTVGCFSPADSAVKLLSPKMWCVRRHVLTAADRRKRQPVSVTTVMFGTHQLEQYLKAAHWRVFMPPQTVGSGGIGFSGCTSIGHPSVHSSVVCLTISLYLVDGFQWHFSGTNIHHASRHRFPGHSSRSWPDQLTYSGRDMPWAMWHWDLLVCKM